MKSSWIVEFEEVQSNVPTDYVNLIDLVKSFPTRIYLQKSASIQALRAI